MRSETRCASKTVLLTSSTVDITLTTVLRLHELKLLAVSWLL